MRCECESHGTEINQSGELEKNKVWVRNVDPVKWFSIEQKYVSYFDKKLKVIND